MKILVYGAGVLGCNLARNLFHAGKDVTLLARGNWAAEIKQTGLRVKDKFSPRTSFEDRKGWGTVRIDSLSNVTISTLAQDDQTMPNVVGMGLKDALFLLESRGLRVSFSGRGSVQYQSIAPGTRISRGGAVTITLK